MSRVLPPLAEGEAYAWGVQANARWVHRSAKGMIVCTRKHRRHRAARAAHSVPDGLEVCPKCWPEAAS